VRSFRSALERFPASQPTMLMALDWILGPAREIVLAGPDPTPFLQDLAGRFLPNSVIARADGRARLPLLEGKGAVDGKSAAYVCTDQVCDRPALTVEELAARLR
jgi:hypothetical protein